MTAQFLGRRERALLILWPAFVMAGVFETLVFVVVDPATLAWFGGASLDWPRQAVYTVTFFIFWAGTAAASALTAGLMHGLQSVPPTTSN